MDLADLRHLLQCQLVLGGTGPMEPWAPASTAPHQMEHLLGALTAGGTPATTACPAVMPPQQSSGPGTVAAPLPVASSAVTPAAPQHGLVYPWPVPVLGESRLGHPSVPPAAGFDLAPAWPCARVLGAVPGSGAALSSRYVSSPVTVEGLAVTLRNLAPGASAVEAVGRSLYAIDSGAMAALLKELQRGGHAWRAVELFDWIRSLDAGHPLAGLANTMTYTTMVSQCGAARSVRRALELVAEMRTRRVPVNVHTYSALMNVCVKAGEPELALDVFDALVAEGVVPNLVTFNTLIDVYGKLGAWQQAVRVLDALLERGLTPEVRTYNTVIIACNMSGQAAEALKVYSRMLAAGARPTATTYTALISAYGKLGELDKALTVFEEMRAKGCERNVITYSSLISACEKAGRWELALGLFDAMHMERCRPNVVTYNSLLAACCQGRQWARAESLVQRMASVGCAPDGVTYAVLMACYDRCGQWQRVPAAYDRMLAAGGAARADAIALNYVLGALWGAGTTWTQRHAAALFCAACRAGHFRAAVQVREVAAASTTGGCAVFSPAAGVAGGGSGLHSVDRAPTPGTPTALTVRAGSQGLPPSPASYGLPHSPCSSSGSLYVGARGPGTPSPALCVVDGDGSEFRAGSSRRELVLEHSVHAFTHGASLLCALRWLADVHDRLMFGNGGNGGGGMGGGNGGGGAGSGNSAATGAPGNPTAAALGSPPAATSQQARLQRHPDRARLIVHRGKPCREPTFRHVRDALRLWLRAWAAPLELSECTQGCAVEGTAADLLLWASTRRGQAVLAAARRLRAVCSAPSATGEDDGTGARGDRALLSSLRGLAAGAAAAAGPPPRLGPGYAAELAQDAAVATRCGEAFAAVRRAESAWSERCADMVHGGHDAQPLPDRQVAVAEAMRAAAMELSCDGGGGFVGGESGGGSGIHINANERVVTPSSSTAYGARKSAKDRGEVVRVVWRLGALVAAGDEVCHDAMLLHDRAMLASRGCEAFGGEDCIRSEQNHDAVAGAPHALPAAKSGSWHDLGLVFPDDNRQPCVGEYGAGSNGKAGGAFTTTTNNSSSSSSVAKTTCPNWRWPAATSAAAAAAAAVAAAAAAAGVPAARLTGLAATAGATDDELHAALRRLRAALRDDLCAVGPVRVLQLLLERLGCATEPGEGGGGALRDATALVVADGRGLAAVARPSTLAAALLVRARRRAGLAPAWPVALAQLTGWEEPAAALLEPFVEAVLRGGDDAELGCAWLAA